MTPLETILAQHDELRAIIDRCEHLADQLDRGRGSAEELAREIVRLRIALEQHNRFEERELAPILRAGIAFPERHIDRMVSEHADEHRIMSRRVSLSPTAEVRATLRLVREHLATEEQHLLRVKQSG